MHDICCHHRLRCILNYIPVSFDAMRSMCFLSNEFSSFSSFYFSFFFFSFHFFLGSLYRESRSLFAIFHRLHLSTYIRGHTITAYYNQRQNFTGAATTAAAFAAVVVDWRLTYAARVLLFVSIVFARDTFAVNSVLPCILHEIHLRKWRIEQRWQRTLTVWFGSVHSVFFFIFSLFSVTWFFLNLCVVCVLLLLILGPSDEKSTCVLLCILCVIDY